MACLADVHLEDDFALNVGSLGYGRIDGRNALVDMLSKRGRIDLQGILRVDRERKVGGEKDAGKELRDVHENLAWVETDCASRRKSAGAKARIHCRRILAARLKPCPDAKGARRFEWDVLACVPRVSSAGADFTLGYSRGLPPGGPT